MGTGAIVSRRGSVCACGEALVFDGMVPCGQGEVRVAGVWRAARLVQVAGLVYREAMKRSMKKKSRAVAVAPPGDESVEEKIARLEREVARLQRVNGELEMEKEILEKGEAFLAKRRE